MMQKKTERLIQLVPDLKIKDRAQAEAEEEAEEGAEPPDAQQNHAKDHDKQTAQTVTGGEGVRQPKRRMLLPRLHFGH